MVKIGVRARRVVPTATPATSAPAPMPATASQQPAPTTTPQFVLVDEPDEITHLVCCRSTDWRHTFCGSLETDAVNATAQRYCAMCVEEAESALPGWSGATERRCPLDGRRCPDDAELDARIDRETRSPRWHRGRRRT